MLRELAYAKLNLVLHVGRPREDGLHPICSLMASIDLADELTADAARVRRRHASTARACPATTSPPRALAEFRSRAGRELPPLELRIDKRIPVAAGLGGGSADAAAALRIANELAGGALAPEELLGSPPTSARTCRASSSRATRSCRASASASSRSSCPRLTAVLVPDARGPLDGRRCTPSSTGSAARVSDLDPEPLRALAARPAGRPRRRLENDLQPAALSLRPDLARALERFAPRARSAPR